MSVATSQEGASQIPRLKLDLRAQSQPKLRSGEESFLLRVPLGENHKPQVTPYNDTFVRLYPLASQWQRRQRQPRHRQGLSHS